MTRSSDMADRPGDGSSASSGSVASLAGNLAMKPARAWLETALLTAAIPAAGWLIDASDPFFLQGFPWLLFAPVLLGLQNGFRYALASSLALVGGAAVLCFTGQAAASLPPLPYTLAVGVLGPIAGKYHEKWQHALAAQQRASSEHGARLARLTRAHHLLERSHNELEQRLAASGPSLHAALEEVRAALAASAAASAADPLASAGDSILQLFCHHGQVQMASLHGMAPDRAGLLPEPLAALGRSPPVDLAHPLIADALATGELTAVRDERAGARGLAPLACVPVVDADGTVWGAVLVHEMPFLAMHDATMMLLATLGGRIGDWLAETTQVRAGEAS